MTTIGRTITITGDIVSDEDLVIEGTTNGQVLVRDATLTIADTARVKADVRGARVIVRGTVRGAISASERIELRPDARVQGSLSANRVVLADGATFNGRIDMDQRTIAARVAQYKAAQAAR